MYCSLYKQWISSTHLDVTVEVAAETNQSLDGRVVASGDSLRETALGKRSVTLGMRMLNVAWPDGQLPTLTTNALTQWE